MYGWGTVGHEIVGNIAWYHLSASSREWVKEILQHHVQQNQEKEEEKEEDNKDDSFMSPLGKVADWADQVRHWMGWSAPLHLSLIYI